MHLIRLTNATFFAHHGVPLEEKKTGNRYEVDVEVKFDFETAARNDDLQQTVCYESMYKIVETIITEKKFDLIESIAYLIAKHVLELSPDIEYAEVSVRKRNPPINGVVDYSEAVYRGSH
ncbi:MAG: dihydroneopterin aldolase [Bacteroidetes bacterium]|nr:dihydroneopterin aldolase [Bacteroidota bacterium]MCY4234270.1 dihydroneopterin aldolase [Bacteroidota bacterium]